MYELNETGRVVKCDGGILPVAQEVLRLGKIGSYFPWKPNHPEATLIQVMAGAGYFTVTETEFVTTDKQLPATSAELLDELFESVYDQMVPPALTANLIVDLRVSPVMGLQGVSLRRGLLNNKISQSDIDKSDNAVEMVRLANWVSDVLKMGIRYAGNDDTRKARILFTDEFLKLYGDKVSNDDLNDEDINTVFDTIYSFIRRFTSQRG